ncbi:hypothetical protein N9K95_03655 [Schleiferiaceae bacterium]|nr:hypothetical protein [Schleiferiaceae bacterium]
MNAQENLNPVNFSLENQTVTTVVTGDLNKDGIDDYVYLVKGMNPKYVVQSDLMGLVDRNRRGIVILLSNSGDYEIAVQNIGCFSSELEEPGNYYQPELDLIVEGSILKVHFAHGRYGYWRYLFRYQDDAFKLIGYFHCHGGAIVEKEVSINFSTRKKKVRVNINENAQGGDEEYQVEWSTFKLENLINLSDIQDFDNLHFSQY